MSAFSFGNLAFHPAVTARLCLDGLLRFRITSSLGLSDASEATYLPSRPLNNSRLLSGGQHLFLTRRVRVAVRGAGPMIFLADFYNCAVQQNAESPRDVIVMTCRRAGARVPADANHPVSGVIASRACHAQACPRACARTPTHPLARGRARSPTVYTPINPYFPAEISTRPHRPPPPDFWTDPGVVLFWFLKSIRCNDTV